MKASFLGLRENYRESLVPSSPEEETHGWDLSTTTSSDFALQFVFKVCTEYLDI